jgi:hypothetical protein
MVDSIALTRYNNPRRFSDTNPKVDQLIEFDLDVDTHVIVVALDAGAPIGPIMGPLWGQSPPVAISNPIFVDVDGGGFQGNMDPLGHPLPVKLDGWIAEPSEEEPK